MAKVAVLLLLIAVCPLLASAQAAPQPPATDFPSVTTPGNTNPEAVSDLNAQLIWLLAAAPSTADSTEGTAARREYQRAAFGHLSSQDQTKLSMILGDFRSRHDRFAADYNSLVPTISRDDLWSEYRDFRVKVNDLVAETIRTINDTFPESSSRFHSTLEECKRNVSITVYRSSVDANYASNPRTATTGFAMIQGNVTNVPDHSNGTGSAPSDSYATAVVVGMVPGCKGKVFPVVMISPNEAPLTGPKTLPWEYMNFQYTARVVGLYGVLGIMVTCEMP